MEKGGVALLVVAGLAVVLWAVRERGQNRLTLANRSGQPVAFLRVTISDETTVFRDVPDGREVVATFRIARRPLSCGQAAGGRDAGQGGVRVRDERHGRRASALCPPAGRAS